MPPRLRAAACVASALALTACHRDPTPSNRTAPASVADAGTAGDSRPMHGIGWRAACQGLAAGDRCTMIWRNHPLPGTCQPSARGLLCRPAPRPEALAACQGKTEGEACTLSFDGHDAQGTCRSTPGAGLACRGGGGFWRQGDGAAGAPSPESEPQ